MPMRGSEGICDITQAYVVCELHEKLNLLWAFIRTHLKV